LMRMVRKLRTISWGATDQQNEDPAMRRSSIQVICAAAFILGCSDATEPIPPPIDPAKTIGHLSPAEAEQFCSWVRALADARLPRNGAEFVCGAQKTTFRWTLDCEFTKHVPDTCRATFGDIEGCYPALFDYLAGHPCEWTTLRTMEELEALLGHVPACSPVRQCIYPNPMPVVPF
jgi:hypothetical protein